MNLYFFSCDKITDQGLEGFNKSLKNLRKLQSINLVFQGCTEITDEGVRGLSEGLKKLDSLQTLNLNLTELSITDKGMNALTNAIKRLNSLRLISLDLRSLAKITDNNLKNLGEAFQGLGSLRSLHLFFYYPYNPRKTTTQGFQKLREVIEGIDTLEEIGLSF